MEDSAIVALFFARNEAAIVETSGKYGRYLTKIAMNILADPEDSEECVSDTYLHAWNAIPPSRPSVLSTFLGRITRNLSIDRLRARLARKRSFGKAEGEKAYEVSLSELEECVPGKSSPEDEVLTAELGHVISGYLRTLPPLQRQLFVMRYYDMEPLQDAAAALGMSIPKAKSMMHRTRHGLKRYLDEHWNV